MERKRDRDRERERTRRLVETVALKRRKRVTTIDEERRETGVWDDGKERGKTQKGSDREGDGVKLAGKLERRRNGGEWNDSK